MSGMDRTYMRVIYIDCVGSETVNAVSYNTSPAVVEIYTYQVSYMAITHSVRVSLLCTLVSVRKCGHCSLVVRRACLWEP